MPAFVPVDPSQTNGIRMPVAPRRDVETRNTLCATCDISCNVVTEIRKGRVVRVRSSDNPIYKDNICMKGILAPKAFAHPDRLLYPLKRVGARGANQWQQVSWQEAMQDIGERLSAIIAAHGPEAWAVSTSQWNTSTDHGLGRRLMNHVGSPNWISGVALCAGNTAAINRMTYGWFPWPDFVNTRCIVLFGHNPRRHSWVPIYNMIRRAQLAGAKLIVLDPRRSSSAERADIWLPLRAGTDAAMMLGWLNTIISEQLYDRDFVAKWTVGFEALRERVAQYPIDRVAEITGCEPEMIRRAARMYASQGPSIIPWTPITDMQRNSTSAIRLQGILRAICGYVDVPGGETLQGVNPAIVPEFEIEMHDMLPQEQKAKQLGADTHPAFTYLGQAELLEPIERVWGHRYVNQVSGCYMANPSATFRAMAGEGPYPVKAFFTLGNNTLLSFANMPLILKAMMNQELIVVHEQFMTPTAQLADYVLPGDSWLERPWLHDLFSWTSMVRPSEKSMEPPGECKSTFEFWKLLAGALGRGDVIPWHNIETFYDYRLRGTGMDWEAFCKHYEIHFGAPVAYRKYERTGFATPSGKVELHSSVLENLGFDPLPYYREAPANPPQYPLTMFAGVREDEYFQTGQRHVAELRARKPEPVIYLSPATAREYGLAEGDWTEVANDTGRVAMQVSIRDAMPDGLVRIPHGWWKPEMQRGLDGLSGALAHADAQLCPDDADYLDREQGIPHLKGLPCKLIPLPGKPDYAL